MTVYTDEWRDEFRESVKSSAVALVPVLVDRFNPANVVDIGAGEGWFVREFRRCGAHAVGFDGPWVEVDHIVDLDAPPYPKPALFGPFDMAVCLEVAEHVQPDNAGALVAWLCELAPLVVFSAATPGQGGVGHVNEQPHEYWVDLFAERGYRVSTDIRDRVANDDRISWWYRNNIMTFAP